MKYVLKSTAPRGHAGEEDDRVLNPEQRAVVEAPAGRILVIAGAGTGKTRTLVHRMARLVRDGCPPERMLLCTFTTRAAREMLVRVEALLGQGMQRAMAGTFHHIGHRILRRYGEALGLEAGFGILDPEDAGTLLESVIAELGLSALSARRFPPAKLLHHWLGLAVGTRTPLAAVVAARAPELVPQWPAIEDVAARFAARKQASHLVDFDDLLTLWHRLLTAPEHAEIGDRLRRAYDHVLVDEYQDIDALQGSLCDAMAERSGSLTCIGDDAQSIYGFRGADFEQIATFAERHAGALVFTLTTNYRSTPEILALANRSIAGNTRGHRKALVASRRSGMVPAVIPLRDVYQQAELVAQRVLELHHEQGLPLANIAVLYRNHNHSLELQVELTRRQIPYAIRSGVRVFEQAHVKDVLAYLRARDNPRDELAWLRVLKQWPGIGQATAQAIVGRLRADPGATRSAAVLREHAASVRGRARAALERLSSLLDVLATAEHGSPGAAIRTVLEAHYGEVLERTFTNAAARKADLVHLAEVAERHAAAAEFLAELALVSGIGVEAAVGVVQPDDKLVLTTVHQAKGLEWPVCFVVGLADGRFPGLTALRSEAALEEERRLFYVASTRAMAELYLCYPLLEDGRESHTRLLRASRFLTEIDRDPPVFERWQITEEPLPDA